MAEITVADLNRMLRDCAGVDEAVSLDDDVQDTPFADLGYDSLAVLELSGQVQRVYSVQMPDEAIEHMLTPRQAVDHINSLLSEARI